MLSVTALRRRDDVLRRTLGAAGFPGRASREPGTKEESCMSTQAKVVRVVVTCGLVLAVLHPAVAGDVKLLGQPGTFPIVITVPGSYRLKSNLTVPDANTSAIDVEANDVALDLNGYVISGPVTCTGTPVTS